MVLPYTLASLVLDFTQMVLAVEKHLEMAIIIILKNPEKPLLMPFLQKFIMAFTKMVLTIWKHFEMTIIIILNNPY